jgi:cbb3-type cytochrome oxidase maturation protein
MTSLAWLIPAALLLGALGLGAFLWALRSGQFEDLDGAAWRALDDKSAGDASGEQRDREPAPPPARDPRADKG